MNHSHKQLNCETLPIVVGRRAPTRVETCKWCIWYATCRPRLCRGRGLTGRTTNKVNFPRGAGFHREGPRRHTHAETAWVPFGPSNWKPQAVRGSGGRTMSNSVSTRKGGRQSSCRHVVSNPTAIRIAQGAIPLGNRRQLMVERKPPNSTGRTRKARQPSRECKSCAKMPWGLACQEMPFFFDWRLGDPAQVKSYRDGKRFLDFVQRRGERRDIQINANRFPSVIDAVRIALEVTAQFRLPGSHIVKRDINHQNIKGWRYLHGVATREPERTVCHSE